MPNPDGTPTFWESLQQAGSLAGNVRGQALQQGSGVFTPSKLADPTAADPQTAATIVDNAASATGTRLSQEARVTEIVKVITALQGGQDPRSLAQQVLATYSDPKQVAAITKAAIPDDSGSSNVPGGGTITTIGDGSQGSIYDDGLNHIIHIPPASAYGAHQTPAQENASNASAAASQAQAGYYGAEAAKLAKLMSMAGTPVDGHPGYVYDANGTPVDVNANQRAIDIIKETARHNLADEINTQQQNTNTSNYNTGQLAIGNRNADTAAATEQSNAAYNTGRLSQDAINEADLKAYQTGQLGVAQGQLGVSQGQLGVSQGQLALAQQKQASDNLNVQQQNALARQQYIAKVLSSPSDFVARAFMESGDTNPGKGITQADLVNKINGDFNSLAPGQQLTTPIQNGPSLLGQQPPLPPSTGSLAPPALANGGMVNDRLLIAGDTQSPAQGTGNPEYISNPTGAPISVIPLNRLAAAPVTRYANGTPNAPGQEAPKNPEQSRLEQAVKAKGKALEHIDDPQLLHQMVDELVNNRQRLGKMTTTETQGVPAYANGTVPGLGVAIQSPENPHPEGFYNGVGGGLPAASSAPAHPAGFFNGVGSGVNTVAAPDGGDVAGYYGRLSARNQGISATGGSPLNPSGQLAPAYVPPPMPANNIAPAPITQDQIVQQAEANVSSRIKQLFGSNFGATLNTANTTPNPEQAEGQTPIRFPFGMFTPQQIAGLTSDEKAALNTYLGVKYNTTLQDVLEAQQQVYSPNRQLAGRLAIR